MCVCVNLWVSVLFYSWPSIHCFPDAAVVSFVLYWRLAKWLDTWHWRLAHTSGKVSVALSWLIATLTELAAVSPRTVVQKHQARPIRKAARLIKSCQSSETQIISRQYRRPLLSTNDCLCLRQVALGNLSRRCAPCWLNSCVPPLRDIGFWLRRVRVTYFILALIKKAITAIRYAVLPSDGHVTHCTTSVRTVGRSQKI